MAGLIVHEWVEAVGGSERVLDQMIRALPDSDVQVLWNDDIDRDGATLRETWLARTPLRSHKALALPVLPATWRSTRPDPGHEWLLVSSHLFAHHVNETPRAGTRLPKLVYTHTPARYIWEPNLDRRGAGLLPRALSALLRPLDVKRAREATSIATNSAFTRDRVQRTWGVDARVIYPPVGIEAIRSVSDWRTELNPAEADTLASLPKNYLLGASRFVSYKRLDLAIQAGEALDLPVVIAGSGPMKAELEALGGVARVPVHLVTGPSDALLRALMQQAELFVFPAVEDFGIMPVEAMACGTPVLVAPVGGAAESVRILEGGSSVNDFTPSGWREAAEQAAKVDRAGLSARSDVFSESRFRAELRSWLDEVVHQ